MTNYAFLVDGQQEKKFIQKVCPNRIVRLLNCNGKNVSATAIVDRIETQCRLLGGRCHPIIVLVDREGRDVTANQLCSQIQILINDRKITDNIIVGVADRMIENWILSDRETLANYCEEKNIPISTEGENGKAILKKLISNYHETTVGVELLYQCKPSRMILNSVSFREFFESLPVMQCNWARN